MPIVNSKNYHSSKYNLVIQGDNTLEGNYQFIQETKNIINRGKDEGFNIPSFSTLKAMDLHIRDLINYGIWDQLDVYFNFDYNNTSFSDFSRINWKSPTSALAVTSGGMTYTVNGWEGNGLDGYINTNFTTSNTTTKYRLASATLGAYVYKAQVGGTATTARICADIASDRVTILNSLSTRDRMQTTTNVGTTLDLSGTGLKVHTKNTTNSRTSYNNVTVSTQTTTDSADGNRTVGLFASVSQSNFGNMGLSMFFLGEFVSQTQIEQYRLSYNKFMIKLNETPNYLEVETQAILNRILYSNNTYPSDSIIREMNTTIQEMKVNGLWAKMDVYNQFAYGDISLLQLSKINWKNPNGTGLGTITNIAPYSQYIQDASWNSTNKTPNAIIAPDGTMTGAMIEDIVGTAQATPLKTLGVATSTGMTVSIYTKAGTLAQRTFNVRNATASVNLQSGVFTYATGTITGTGWSATPVGDGWFRLSYTTSAGAVNAGQSLSLYHGRSSSTVSTAGTWYVWGVQMEAGSTATPYIMTSNVAATNSTIFTLNGGLAYTVNGWESDGTGYIDTGFNPSVGTNNYTLNNAARSMTVYRTALSGTARLDGNTTANLNNLGAGNSANNRINGTASLSSAFDFSGIGYKAIIRNSSTDVLCVNMASQGNRPASSSSLPTVNQELFRNQVGVGDAGLSTYAISSSLTYDETQTFRNIINRLLINVKNKTIA